MSDAQTTLDTSDFYHSALNTLVSSLQINSTPSTSNTSHSNSNSFQKHFHSADESKFFTFCSTIKQCSNKDKCKNAYEKEQTQDAGENFTNNINNTPKRSLATTKKQKLFKSTESLEEFKPKIGLDEKLLSPQSLLLKQAIIRLECMQRRQEKLALNKKPMRTYLRV